MFSDSLRPPGIHSVTRQLALDVQTLSSVLFALSNLSTNGTGFHRSFGKLVLDLWTYFFLQFVYRQNVSFFVLVHFLSTHRRALLSALASRRRGVGQLGHTATRIGHSDTLFGAPPRLLDREQDTGLLGRTAIRTAQISVTTTYPSSSSLTFAQRVLVSRQSHGNQFRTLSFRTLEYWLMSSLPTFSTAKRERCFHSVLFTRLIT